MLKSIYDLVNRVFPIAIRTTYLRIYDTKNFRIAIQEHLEQSIPGKMQTNGGPEGKQ